MKNKTLYKLTIATLAISSIVNPMVSFTESQAARQTISASRLDTSQIKSQITKLTNEINRAKSDLRRIDKEAIDYYLELQNFGGDSGDYTQTKAKLEAEYNSTFKQLKEVDAKYNQIKSQLDNQSSGSSLSSSEQQRLNELSKIYENEELDGMRFYKSLNDQKLNEDINSANRFQSTAVSGKSELEMALTDGKDSALSLDNQITSAKMLIKANEKRAQYGLPKINTSAHIQFLTQVKLEGDKKTNRHYPLEFAPNLNENLLHGGSAFKDEPWEDLLSNYFKLGYDEEKEVFDSIIRDLYPGTTFSSLEDRHKFYRAHRSEIESEASRRNKIIGHYTNLLNFKNKSLMGMSTAYGFVNNTFISKTYAELNNLSAPISPQQLLNQLENFKQTDANNKAEYKRLLAKKSGKSSDTSSLQRQLNELAAQKQTLTNKLNTLRSKIAQIDKTIGSSDVKSKYEAKMKEYKAKITQINAKINQVNALKAKVNDPNKLLKIAYPEIPVTSEEKEKEMAIKADEEEKAKQLELEKNSPQKPLTPEELAQQKSQQKDKQNSEEEIMDLGEIDHSKDKKTTQPKLQADEKGKAKSSEKASTNVQKAKINKTSNDAQSNDKRSAQQVNKLVERKADLPKSGGVPETGDLTNNAGLLGIIGSSLVGMFAAWKNRKKDQ